MRVRDRILKPVYDKWSCEGRYVFIDKGRMVDILQRKLAVDTLLQKDGGEVVAIEEKIVRWSGREYDSLCLETDSCTVPGHESQGWMHYSEADYLFYCMCQGPIGGSSEKCGADCQNCWKLQCFIVEFQPLKEWFWPRYETFSPFKMKDTINHTAGRVVPVRQIARDMKVLKRTFKWQ